MALNVTIIDHHIIPDPGFIHNVKLTVAVGYDQENYFNNAQPYIDRSFDFVFMDENPDAMLASAIYLLGQEKPPPYRCLSRELKARDWAKLAEAGKENILVLNTLRVYYSDFDPVDTITLLNPHESGLQNISVSQILYKASASPTLFMRDLAAVAIAMDYTLDESVETVVEVVSAYPDMFPDLLDRIRNISLNKYNVLDSAFGELAALFRAPSIISGERGVETVLYQLLKNHSFSLTEFLEEPANTAVEYLQKCSAEYKKILTREHKYFEKEKEVRGPVVIYTPHYRSENFVRMFADIKKDQNIDSIVVIKIPTPSNRFKYSIRRGELEIDLGKILNEMGVGGGNPFAAGCTVPEAEPFEKAFLKKISEAGFMA